MSTTDRIIKRGKEKIENAVFADNKNFEECLNIVASTKEGQYVLSRLMDKCGFLRSAFVQTPDGILDSGTNEYRGGRQSIWIYELYRYLSVSNLKKILFLNRRRICQQERKIQEKA